MKRISPLRRLPALLLLTGLTMAGLTMVGLPGIAEAPSGGRWLDSVDAARAAATESGKPILVDLYADWCGWCKVLEDKVFTTPRFERFAEGFVLLRVDVEDGGEGGELQARFGAFSLPTTVIMDADLALIGRLEGFSPVDGYIAGLETEIAEHEALLTIYRQLGEIEDLDALTKLADELHDRGDGQRAVEVYERLGEIGDPSPIEAGRLAYRQADALRLAGAYAEAGELVERARRAATAGDDRQLLEACDLLRARLARQRGDCEDAARVLQAFLTDYPDSRHRGDARAALRSLSQLCA